MPQYIIKLLPEAKQDIQQTTDYLNGQKSKLGNKYFIEVAEAIDILKTNPLIFQKKYQEIRQAPLKKYSYLIHYLIDEKSKTVIVLAVLHTSSNPQKWKNREP